MKVWEPSLIQGKEASREELRRSEPSLSEKVQPHSEWWALKSAYSCFEGVTKVKQRGPLLFCDRRLGKFINGEKQEVTIGVKNGDT